MKPLLPFTIAAALSIVLSVAYAPVWVALVTAALLSGCAGALRLVTTAATPTTAPARTGTWLDTDGAFEIVDPSARQALGLDGAAELTRVDDVVGPHDAAVVRDLLHTVSEHPGVMATVPVRVRAASDWLDAEVTLVSGAVAGHTGVLATFEDVTRERVLEVTAAARDAQVLALATVTTQALNAADGGTLAQTAVSSIRSALQVDGVELYRCHGASPEFSAGVAPGGMAMDRDAALDMSGRLVAETNERDEIVAEPLGSRSHATALGIPMPDGVLVLRALTPRDFTDADIAFVRSVTDVVTLARRQRGAEQDAFRRSRHDELTGLVNREVFLERLRTWIRRSGEQGEAVAVLLLDLDHFKIVNDSLGHTAGDALLEAVSERLNVGLRPGDTLARFGGDEFVILARGLASVDQATLAGRRMQAALAEGFALGDRQVQVTASVGVAHCTDPATSAETLLQEADMALNRAKERGRERVELFEASMLEETVTRLRTESELREALADDQLRVFYQPLVDLGTGATAAVEALVRWVHPGRGLVTPAEFIPISEATGLIEEIGAWVINETCRQARAWTDDDAAMPVSINISPRQVGDTTLLQTIDDAVRRHGIDPSLLTVELTESSLMNELGATLGTLHALRERGISIAIDDFGTGYSSLAYLRSLPIDMVKIDRTFVAGIDRSGDDYAIVAAIIRLAQALGKKVVAEGVETEQQLDLLTDLGCDLAQGFLFSPAVFELEHTGADQAWSRLVLDGRR